MADPSTAPANATATKLTRVSPLSPRNGKAILNYQQLQLEERKALTAFQVLSFNDRHAAVAVKIEEALGFECSAEPGVSTTDGQTQISWNGPNSWMIVCSDQQSKRNEGELLATLKHAVGNFAAVVDQSHGRCGLRISGARAPLVLAKVCALDLHPKVFRSGHCALTSIAHMNASIIKVNDKPTYDLFVIRSLARSFVHALEQAGLEFQGD